MNKEFILKNLSNIVGIDFFEVTEDDVLLSDENSHNPISFNPQLRRDLIEKCKQQEIPVIKVDENRVLWSCIFSGDTFIICGPAALYSMNLWEVHRFYLFYGVGEKDEKYLPVLSFSKYLSLIKLCCKLLQNQEYGDEQLIFGNGLSSDDLREMEQGVMLHELHDETIDHISHTYQEERKVWEYMQKGDYDKVYYWNQKLMSDSESLCVDKRRHWYDMSIVAITLCTRAAIDGGLPPVEAYRISGYYINRLNLEGKIIENQHVLNNALKNLADKVADLSRKKSYSNYVEQCCDYIVSHYKEKILIEDISSAMGISRGYLSKIFGRKLELHGRSI